LHTDRWAYYNDTDKFCCEWLRRLIAAGHIASGEVDERDIRDVSPDDVRGFAQCHWFAGIGVWSYALRLAGWPDGSPVWTGSCPCQPFSSPGKRKGFADERHLWPYWHWLIQQCRPPVILGEQVTRAIKVGWLDLVSSDLEGIGYAIGSADIPAAGVGAPHIRQRLYFLAQRMAQPGEHGGEGHLLHGAPEHRGHEGLQPGDGSIAGILAHAGQGDGGIGQELGGTEEGVPGEVRRGRVRHDAGDGKPASALAYADGTDRGGDRAFEGDGDAYPVPTAYGEDGRGRDGAAGTLADPQDPLRRPGDGGGEAEEGEDQERGRGPGGRGADGGVGHPGSQGLPVAERKALCGEGRGGEGGAATEPGISPPGPWDSPAWVPCRDGRLRPIQRSPEPMPAEVAARLAPALGLVRYGDTEVFSPLTESTPNRRQRLSGYGNSLCAPQAAEFVRACMDVL